jgi:phage terminase small subunit
MAATAYSDRGSKQLNDKERMFVDYYLNEGLDQTKAAIKAGYSAKSAHAIGNQIMRRPHIKKAIGKAAKEVHEELTLTTEEVLKQLYYIVTRDVREFVDEEGIALPLHKLGDRAAQSVDGFDQEINEYVNLETGIKTRTIKNKLKLVGKAGAIDMAMKYQGLFKQDNDQKQTHVTLDFTKLFQPHIEANDPVETAIDNL